MLVVNAQLPFIEALVPKSRVSLPDESLVFDPRCRVRRGELRSQGVEGSPSLLRRVLHQPKVVWCEHHTWEYSGDVDKAPAKLLVDSVLALAGLGYPQFDVSRRPSPIASSTSLASSDSQRTASAHDGLRNESAAVNSWIASMMFVLPTAFAPTRTVRDESGSSSKSQVAPKTTQNDSGDDKTHSISAQSYRHEQIQELLITRLLSNPGLSDDLNFEPSRLCGN